MIDAAQIVDLYRQGHSIDWIVAYVKKQDGYKTTEARNIVLQAIMDNFKERDKQ